MTMRRNHYTRASDGRTFSQLNEPEPARYGAPPPRVDHIHYPSMEWGNDVLTPPIITKSVNGWVYKPDQARTKSEIRSGKNKSWDRTSGLQPAADWISEWMTRQLDARDWQLPDRISSPNITVPVEPNNTLKRIGDGFAVMWSHPTFGWMRIELGLERYGGTTRFHYAIQAPRILLAFLYREWIHRDGTHPTEVLADSGVRSISVSDSHRLVAKWIEDPWSATRKAMNIPESWTDLLQPPRGNLPFNQRYDRYRNRFGEPADVPGMPNVRTMWWGAGDRLAKGIEGRRFTQQDYDALESLFSMFRFTGSDIAVSFMENYGARNTIGLTFEIPAEDVRGNHHGHKLRFDQHGVHIECGYITDEERWVDYQKRHAMEMIKQMEEEWNETSIDVVNQKGETHID